jgi:hypothetical protein
MGINTCGKLGGVLIQNTTILFSLTQGLGSYLFPTKLVLIPDQKLARLFAFPVDLEEVPLVLIPVQ